MVQLGKGYHFEAGYRTENMKIYVTCMQILPNKTRLVE